MVLSGLTFQRVVSRAVFAFLSVFSLISVRAQPQDVAGTMPEDYLPPLKEILAIALRQAPDVIARAFDRSAQDAKIYGADAGRLPQLSGNFRYGSTATATSTNTSSQSRDNGFFYDFGLNQNLFHWGALKNQSDAARINALVADKSYALAYRELSVQLRNSYLALIVEKSRVRHARESLRVMQQEALVTDEKAKQGTVSSAVVEGERFVIRETALGVERVEADFAANRDRFRRLAGVPSLPEEAIPDDIPRPVFPTDLAAAMTAALLRDGAQRTLEYEIYDLRVQEAIKRYKIEQVRLLPKFSANAGYRLENNTSVNGNSVEQKGVTIQTLSVGGQWNIFDGLATRGAIREALVNRRSMEHRRTVEAEKIQLNAQILARTLKLDASQLEFTENRVGMANQARDRTAEEVGFGNIAKNEVARAALGVIAAEATNLAARAAYLGHWSEFVSAAGQDPVLNTLPRHVREKK